MVRWLVLVLVMVAGSAAAELNSLFAQGQRDTDATAVSATRSSLFVSTQERGFFAPLPERAAPAPASARNMMRPLLGTGHTQVDQLLSLIAQAEAGSAGYDAVQYGATVRPSRRPTQMTLGDIYRWIDDTPGQPHAIGRYQFIPPTLRRVASIRGFGPETRFTPGVQDALAVVLLEDAGFAQFQAGALGRRQFMRNLSRIWAGLPLPSGKSYYEGHAGNTATMSWAVFEGGMARIWGS